jgi:hypothetical protein
MNLYSLSSDNLLSRAKPSDANWGREFLGGPAAELKKHLPSVRRSQSIRNRNDGLTESLNQVAAASNVCTGRGGTVGLGY